MSKASVRDFLDSLETRSHVEGEFGTEIQLEIDGVASRLQTQLIGIDTDRILIVKTRRPGRVVAFEQILARFARMQQLDRDEPIELGVVGFEDGPLHSAADAVDDLVTAEFLFLFHVGAKACLPTAVDGSTAPNLKLGA